MERELSCLRLIKANFENEYPDIKNFIAVIIGGSAKNYKLTMENAKRLLKISRIGVFVAAGCC